MELILFIPCPGPCVCNCPCGAYDARQGTAETQRTRRIAEKNPCKDRRFRRVVLCGPRRPPRLCIASTSPRKVWGIPDCAYPTTSVSEIPNPKASAGSTRLVLLIAPFRSGPDRQDTVSHAHGNPVNPVIPVKRHFILGWALWYCSPG